MRILKRFQLLIATLMWLLTCCLILVISGQSQNAIGAHRVFQKTSFSCTGRPAGYYADIETGCQVYHMCDALGRQFSYSCPNTTLFQQRMLICDHWYMVNCSKAESDYAANLLIGQRDKPFVNDEENNLRTPRPDLLDRPYAPDYSGESFRNQYKTLSASNNQIHDDVQKKNVDKQLANGQTRWKIPLPSRTILPPAYEPQIELSSTTQTAPTFTRSSYSTSTSKRTTVSTTTTTTTRRPTISFNQKNNSNNNKNQYHHAALHPRKSEVFGNDQDDLGTSHSTRYNTSADFSSDEDDTSVKAYKPGSIGKFNAQSLSVKTPSKIYEPPFLFPIYNQNETLTTSSEKPFRVSTATPFTAPPTSSVTPPSTTTGRTLLNRPTTLAGKPFSSNTYSSIATTTARPTIDRNQNSLIRRNDVSAKATRTPTPAQGFKAPTTTPRTSTKQESVVVPPTNDLQPPYVDFVLHDIATTQGPPIYYEWKIPSNGLEPPKLDPPIGVNGREYPELVADYNSISAVATSPEANAQEQFKAKNNPFLASSFSTKTTKTTTTTTAKASTNTNVSGGSRTPTSRSIKDTAQPNNFDNAATLRAQRRQDATSSTDIIDLRKELLIPDYAFPLENIGRTGYLAADTYNSFQLKIPDRQGNIDHTHWFGENPKCPECHPSYVVPGTCEPCLRR